ncbi:amino acid ABC transporter permease [Maritalea sp. S77]|uniref:amino acid ABC transporter permease n=1 Tax=Maritalea sp. S77 TaxID=3415125 RepID=UPI003C7C5B9C
MTNKFAYVRTEMAPDLPAPVTQTGIVGWMRKNLFSDIPNTIMTLLALAFLVWTVPTLYNFLIGNAIFVAEDGTPCRAPEAGACWAYVIDRFDFYIYGFYPESEYWRPNLVFVVAAALITHLLWPDLPFKGISAIAFFVGLPIFAIVLLNGGNFGLMEVTTEKWGGLMLTLIIASVGIVVSLPLGVVLALGRRSHMPFVKYVSIAFIELWRAVPLITVLFMASVMLPLFLPEGTTIDKILRALVGVALFQTAYMAEVVRGGLQALPKGQYEAAHALGLNYFKSMYFIILPQALKHVIPGIVNSFISLFKDTSLVSIVGLFDLLGTVQATSALVEWKAPHQATTGYLFAAAVFWIFCFGMSRYSIYMERRLDTGHKE